MGGAGRGGGGDPSASCRQGIIASSHKYEPRLASRTCSSRAYRTNMAKAANCKGVRHVNDV